MRTDLPSGTVTFLFTDVEGSTRLLHELGAEAYADALAEHRRVIREACVAEGGVEVDTQGDAFFFAFPSAPGAAAAAASLTQELCPGPIQVRVGLHTGSPLVAEEGYVGDDVHFAARVAATSHGGQVVLSAATAELVADEALTSLGSHRLKDISEPVSIYQLGVGSFPPLKTIANSNLPTPASSFLGREDELYEADELLQSTRLLTIAGPGGQGKTRFSVELARRAREERFGDYPDGVFSSFLASLRDPSLVLPTICQTLNVKEQAGQSALDALTSHLQRKKMLLLLDNAEHLLDAAPELSQLLRQAEGLTLLVTSRELLRIHGETPYSLPPLRDDEGVALFCERARTEPSEDIAELCLRLEGLPLAIELAAARTAILTPAQLLERLSQRLDLLKGTRDADPRQQTLRATIEWSYDLLSADEQQLFARISVFAGGCTLEAAEEVCDADLDSLQALVDKSLLRFTQERFWMLETIREFAWETMRALGINALVRDRHATWMLGLAGRAEEGLERSSQQQWMRELERELDNVRATHSFLEETQRVEDQLDLVGRLWNFWYLRGGYAEARRLAAAPLAVTRGDRTRRRAGALHAECAFAERIGDSEAARKAALESLSISRELGDAKGVSWQLANLGMLAANADDMEASARCYEESIQCAREVGDSRTVAFGKGNLADAALRRGEYETALTLAGEVEGVFRELDLAQGIDWMASTRAFCLFRLGRVEQAAATATRSLRGNIRGDVTAVIWDLTLLAACAGRLDRSVAGARILGAAAATLATVGIPLTGPEGELYVATADELQLQLGQERYEAELAEGRAMAVDDAVELVLGVFPDA